MSTRDNENWDGVRDQDLYPLALKRKREDIHSLDSSTILEEYEKIENERTESWMLNLKNRQFEAEEELEDLLLFIDETIEIYSEKIPVLKDYTKEFDERSGEILITFLLSEKLSMEERRFLARVQVLILEKISIHRIEFQKIYI